MTTRFLYPSHMMATGKGVTARLRGFRSNFELWPTSGFTPWHRLHGGCEGHGCQAVKPCCGSSEAFAQKNHVIRGTSHNKPQELLLQDLLCIPALSRNGKQSKEAFDHLNAGHKKTTRTVWLNNRCQHALGKGLLARWNAQPLGFASMVVQENFGNLVPHLHKLNVPTCRQLCEHGRIREAVEILNLLVQKRCHVPQNLFYHILKRCIARKDHILGRQVHALIVETGYAGNAFLATHLIGLYAIYGELEEAMLVFSTVSTPDIYNWASIILAHARHGEPTEAIRLYQELRKTAVKPDNCTFVAVLRACGSAGNVAAGKNVHADILHSAGKPDLLVQNCLVDMYVKCRSLGNARRVFDSLPVKDVVTWTSMIAGYSQQGLGQEALCLYGSMQDEGITPPDSFIFACLLQACATSGAAAFQQGKEVHAQMEVLGLMTDVVVGNSLLNMYMKCGCLEDAQRVFDRLVTRDVMTWNSMIEGYVQQGMGVEALRLYSRMQGEGIVPPNAITYVCVLQACAIIGIAAVQQGMEFHRQIEERGLLKDTLVANTLISMYAKCGSLQGAQKVFGSVSARNVVTWTAMIAAYAQEGLGHESLSLFNSMQQEGIAPPDVVTFVCLLQACAGVGVAALDQGRQLHAQIEAQGLQADVVIGGSLINMYCHCGSLEDALLVFNTVGEKNVVTWNAMITGYVQHGMANKAFDLYFNMQQEDRILPDSVTFVSLLSACANEAALPLGKQLHAQLQVRGLQADMIVGSSLVCMYAKCGTMADALQVFDSLPQRETAAWNALVAGYTWQGDSTAVFNLLDRMRLDGIQPDGTLFRSVLTVCSHVGLVDEGRAFFHAMTTVHGITPTVEHYTCMVDLLGRAGYLDDALRMIWGMHCKPDGAVWRTLMGSCQKWGHVELGQRAFNFAISLDNKDAAAYALMWNIYAQAEMWEEAKKVQAKRVEFEVCKEAGQSRWTGIDGTTHAFVVGSCIHQKPGEEVDERKAELTNLK